VLREVRRFHFYVLKNLPDGKLSRPQGFDHVNAGGVCENLEHARLKGAEGCKMFGIEGGFRHVLQYIRNFATSQLRNFATSQLRNFATATSRSRLISGAMKMKTTATEIRFPERANLPPAK
jgi:hypothetical protein